MTDVLESINTRRTSQFERSDARQVKNGSGAFVFEVSDEERLRRFLILGTEGGTFGISEAKLTRENADLILKFVNENPVRLVQIVTEISVEGRAPKQNPLIFALAAATSTNDPDGKKAAFAAMPAVLRTGTHFMLFEKYVAQFRGRGMGLRKAEFRWLNEKSPDSLAYQMVKYRQREGYTWRDLLRMVKQGKTEDKARDALYGWAARGVVSKDLPQVVKGFLMAQEATKVADWVALIEDFNLSWEMLPDAALGEAAVWRSLIDNGIGWTALQRQLPRLTNLGVISPLGKNSRLDLVEGVLTDVELIRKSRVHPFNILVALRTYAQGQGFKGSQMWKPVQRVVDALDQAFYLSFATVEGTGKNTMISLDVSGSMTWHKIANSPLTPREASAAMSLVTAATEKKYLIAAFSGSMAPLDISPEMRLDDVLRTVGRATAGPTDCSLPFEFALAEGLAVDTFITYTDSETNGGNSYRYGGRGSGRGNPIQVHQALNKYRNETGIPARHVVVGMEATGITVLDPSDPGSLGLVGFDSAAPALIADFSAGRI